MLATLQAVQREVTCAFKKSRCLNACSSDGRIFMLQNSPMAGDGYLGPISDHCAQDKAFW